MRNTRSLYDYVRWTRANGVHLARLVARVAPECAHAYWRTCGNVSVDVNSVARVLDRLLKRVAQPLAWGTSER